MLFKGIEVELGDHVIYHHKYGPMQQLQGTVFGLGRDYVELQSDGDNATTILREGSAILFRIDRTAAEEIPFATGGKLHKDQLVRVASDTGLVAAATREAVIFRVRYGVLRRVAMEHVEAPTREDLRAEAVRQLALSRRFTPEDVGKLMLYSYDDPPTFIAVTENDPKALLAAAKGSQVLNGWVEIQPEHVRT